MLGTPYLLILVTLVSTLRSQAAERKAEALVGAVMVMREWTPERMLRAKPADVPSVSQQKLDQWAEEPATAETYDVRGGPGFDEGGAGEGKPLRRVLDDDAAPEVPPVPEEGVVASSEAYAYPPPYTRYESFPSYNIYPHNTVGKVFFSKPGDGDYVCSGASVGGDGVMTAAHCVIDSRTRQVWTNWVFVPAYHNGVAPYGQWAANHLWAHPWYANGEGGDNRFDVGGAVVYRRNGKRLSQIVGWLGFGWNLRTGSSSSSASDISVLLTPAIPSYAHWAIVGYPHAPPFNGQLQYICQTSFAYSPPNVPVAPIGVGCDQSGGTSGGPWIRNYGGRSSPSANLLNGVNSFRRCYDGCSKLYVHELWSPYFDDNVKALKDCIVNSVPGNPANPKLQCAPGS